MDDEQRARTNAEQVLRRMCQPKKSGRLEVSSEVQKVWQNCGAGRKQLVDALLACNGDKDMHAQVSHCGMLFHVSSQLGEDAFKKRVEHQLSKSRRSKTTIQAGFYSKEKMKASLGFSAPEAKFTIGALRMSMHKCDKQICDLLFVLPRDRVKAVVKYCSDPRRRGKFIRWASLSIHCECFHASPFAGGTSTRAL